MTLLYCGIYNFKAISPDITLNLGNNIGIFHLGNNIGIV